MIVCLSTSLDAFVRAAAQYGGTKVFYTSPDGIMVDRVFLTANSVPVMIWRPSGGTLTLADLLVQFNNATRMDGDISAV